VFPKISCRHNIQLCMFFFSKVVSGVVELNRPACFIHVNAAAQRTWRKLAPRHADYVVRAAVNSVHNGSVAKKGRVHCCFRMGRSKSMNRNNPYCEAQVRAERDTSLGGSANGGHGKASWFCQWWKRRRKAEFQLHKKQKAEEDFGYQLNVVK